MNYSILRFLTFVVLPSIVLAEKFAYVSVLSSNEFLITARTLAHRLKSFNESIPYIIIVTEEISNSSIAALEQQGVQIMHFHKIDTPYIKTHTAKKYQYTKIRLWSLVEYTSIAHLDLDLLPVADISSIFLCGTFCASFRHSDMFNSGVFVLKPNLTIFEDMQKRVQGSYSYDGGDQGFLNTYFDDLKYAPMFDEENITSQRYNSSLMRLSAVFNYDIGMYYLNGGRMLVVPKIIHYTMGPTKPWIWWTYPLFDLNNIWLQARFEMEEAYNVQNSNFILASIQLLVTLTLICLKRIIESLVGDKLRAESLTRTEANWSMHLIMLLSVYICVKLVPLGAHPVPAWIFFICNLITMVVTVSSLYASIRLGLKQTYFRLSICVLLLFVSSASSWLLVANINSFGRRAIIATLILLYNQLFFVFTLKRFTLTNCDSCVKYQLLPTSTKTCDS